MILYSGECDYCKWTWEDEKEQNTRCPNCGLSDISTWAYEVEGNLRRLSDVK